MTRLCEPILEPVSARFGHPSITYGFASPALTKSIQERIAPALDQHAGARTEAQWPAGLLSARSGGRLPHSRRLAGRCCAMDRRELAVRPPVLLRRRSALAGQCGPRQVPRANGDAAVGKRTPHAAPSQCRLAAKQDSFGGFAGEGLRQGQRQLRRAHLDIEVAPPLAWRSPRNGVPCPGVCLAPRRLGPRFGEPRVLDGRRMPIGTRSAVHLASLPSPSSP